MQSQEGWASSQLELELRCHLLEIDRRVEINRCEEYRGLMLAMVTSGHPGQLLPALAPAPRPELIPVPVGGSSSVAAVTAISGPPGAVVAAVQEHHSALPNLLASSSSSSQLSGGASEPGRGRVSGRSGRVCGGRAGATASGSLTQGRLIDAGSPRNAINDDDGLSRTSDGPASRNTTSATSNPRALRELFRHSLANGIPAGPRFDPLSVASHPPPLRAGSGRFESRAAVDLFLRENGIESSSQLAPQDSALADATPNVTPKRFSALFGGHPQHERPRSREQNIICINPVSQPYAPRAPGEPGVFFVVPGSPLFEDDRQAFRLFTNVSPRDTPIKARQYLYLGEYSKVPITNMSIEVEDWLSLPIRCRAQWSWRILSSGSPKIRAICAKLAICNTRPDGPPASQGEIDAWVKDHPRRGYHEGIKEGTLLNALDSGKERMDFTVVKCVGYSIDVSLKMQGLMAPS